MSAGWLCEHLEQQILSGAIAQGTGLPSERELATDFGLSRPMVREAIGRLVERGIVTVHPGRGAFVRVVGPDDAARPLERLYRHQNATARSLVEARTMLESEAAGLAASRATPDDHALLRDLLDAFDDTSGIIERARLDLAFHQAVVTAARNPMIATMFASVRRLAFNQMLHSLSNAGIADAGVPQHRDLLAALERRAADEARAIAAHHMEVAISAYGSDLDVPLSALANKTVRTMLGPDASIDDLSEMPR